MHNILVQSLIYLKQARQALFLCHRTAETDITYAVNEIELLALINRLSDIISKLEAL